MTKVISVMVISILNPEGIAAFLAALWLIIIFDPDFIFFDPVLLFFLIPITFFLIPRPTKT